MSYIIKYRRCKGRHFMAFVLFLSLLLGAIPNGYSQSGDLNLNLNLTDQLKESMLQSVVLPSIDTSALEFCGDGTKNGVEECDGTDGVSAGQSCSLSCTLEYCGDRKLTPPEECDGTLGITDSTTQECTDCKITKKDLCAGVTTDDSNACTTDSCDPATGTVTNTAIDGCCTADSDCRDGDKCNGMETCVSNACVDGTALDCNDSNDCTTDSCDATAGCTNETIASATGNACGTCGDGILNTGEECDGTATEAGKTCASDCTFVVETDTGTCGDGTVDSGEECDGTAGITDSTKEECSSECKIVAKETSPCLDGSTPTTVFCYGTEKAAGETNSGYCNNSSNEPAVEIRKFTAPKDLIANRKALLMQDDNLIFRTDLATGTTKRILSSQTFTKITDLAFGSTGALYIADAGKVLKATPEGVTDLNLSITVERLTFDKDGNKYLLTDEGKLYKTDTADALTLLYDIKAELKATDFKPGGRMVIFKGALYLNDLAGNRVLKYDLAGNTLSVLAEIKTPVELSVKRSTGDLLVQSLDEGTIYKIPLEQAVAGQTSTPEVYMLARATGMIEARICPPVKTIEPPCEASTEECDGADNDCDGSVDEDLTEACYTGADGTENVGICAGGTKTCANGAWSDCSGETTPESSDTCDDDLDNDCDGTSDEGCNCTEGETQSCGSDEGECVAGTQTCANNQWSDDCDGETGPSDETCDGADNDCDGETDEDLTEACYTGAAGTENVGVCTGGTKNCTSGSWGDCEGETTPASSETCDDGLDNDCDGTVDEDCADSGETPVETSASAIDNCVPSDGSPSTLGSDDFDPALSISDILGLQEGGLITTYAAGQEYTATWNDSTGKVDLKSVATGEMTTCEYLAEAEVGVRAAGGGCLNMGGSAAMPASPVPFIWLIVNLGVLFGFRLRRLFLRHRNSQL